LQDSLEASQAGNPTAQQLRVRQRSQAAVAVAQRSAAAANGSADGALALADDDATSEEEDDPFEQEVKLKFRTANNTDHPETMVSAGLNQARGSLAIETRF
jgi:hypothetical protein